MQALLRETNGQAEYKHHNGVLLIVNIAMAGMGIKRVPIANLPPEVKEHDIRTTLTSFGTVLAVIEKMWPKTYKVPNGVLQVTITLTQHIPSRWMGTGHYCHMKDRQPHAMDVETSVISIRRASSVGTEGRCLVTNNT